MDIGIGEWGSSTMATDLHTGRGEAQKCKPLVVPPVETWIKSSKSALNQWGLKGGARLKRASEKFTYQKSNATN